MTLCVGSMPTYHVTCRNNSSKKLVTVDDRKNIIDAIRTKFGVDDRIILQQQYQDDWLDVDEDDELIDGTKLCFNHIAEIQVQPARKSLDLYWFEV